MGPLLHQRLRAALEDPQSEEWFDVILELRPVEMEAAGNPAERAARLQATFHARAEPVEQAVRNAGGEVLGTAWINSTLKCRIPARALKELMDRQDLIKIDLPRPLSRQA